MSDCLYVCSKKLVSLCLLYSPVFSRKKCVQNMQLNAHLCNYLYLPATNCLS